MPGPHPVGFSQRWIIDSTRRLPHGGRLRFRPILVNLWYPASRLGRSPMRYDDYFSGPIGAAGSDRALADYATALIGYQRRVAWAEVAGAVRDSTPAELARRLDGLLAGGTFVFRDVPHAPGRHRVVVYTSGAGSSMDDNVVLCEYLASRGYLVIGSAFPAEDNAGFGTRASDESRQRDVRRLLLEIARITGPIDGPVTVIGHSAGAQAMQLFAADPSAPIDAVISLDTTEDYSMLSDRTWAYFTDRVVERRRDVKVPIMYVAGPEALFELADSLHASRRWLVTVPDLDHNDFISQGVIRRRLRTGLPDDDAALRERVSRANRSLAEYIGRWVDAQHSGATDSIEVAAPLTVVGLEPGIGRPPPVTDVASSARELRHLFMDAAPDQFAERAIATRRANPEIATNQVLMMLLVDAIRKGHPERARAAFEELAARDSTVRRIPKRIESRAKLFESIGAPAEGRAWRELLRPFEARPAQEPSAPDPPGPEMTPR